MAMQLPGFEAELSIPSRVGAYQAAALTAAEPTLVQPAQRWANPAWRGCMACLRICSWRRLSDDCWSQCGCDQEF